MNCSKRAVKNSHLNSLKLCYPFLARIAITFFFKHKSCLPLKPVSSTYTFIIHVSGGVNVCHNWKPFSVAWMWVFTYSVGYCRDGIGCDGASNAPGCPLSNGVYIVQGLLMDSQTLPERFRNRWK